MMRMRTKNNALPPDFNVGRAAAVEKEWELRPGGMLVQKRTDDGESRVPPPTIRVRVKYGSIYHEIRISSQSTFGELKKMLSGPTGLHHQDQKLYYKDRERDSMAYLDSAGVKDKSKIMLEEDAISKEKRFIEMRKNAIMEKAAKMLSDISLEVDRLGTQVSALETVISKGGKVVEKDVVTLTELLMNQLLKLDAITADGDVKLQRKLQVRRIQKYVEKLDLIKLKNSMPSGNGHQVRDMSSSPAHHHRNLSSSVSPPIQHQQARHSLGDSLMDCDSPKQQEPSRHSASGGAVVITTQWETFDSASNPFLGAPSTSNTEKSTIRATQPSFSWNLL